MPDLMQHVCATHPELAVCASSVPAPDLHYVMDQAYYNLAVWLGGLGAGKVWMLAALAFGCCVVCTLLTLWTADAGQGSCCNKGARASGTNDNTATTLPSGRLTRSRQR
jgi:hypothetical protein